jgi:hypothetical protein
MIFLEPTFRRTLNIWWAWFWRWALLGVTPVALAFWVDYYNTHSSQPSGLLALVVFLTVVVAPFWAYAYTFRLIFAKSLGGVRIRLQPLSPAGSASQPQTFLTPTRPLTRKIRKKWTSRSWRWGLGFLIAMLLFGLYAADGWLKRPHVLTGPSSADSLVASFLIIVLFFGTPLGWLVGTALELKSIFKGDFGEFKVCLISEPSSGLQK